MARAQGARSAGALAFEASYGVTPASGFIKMPFASVTLGLSQPLIDNELLGFGRDPLPPVKDAITVDGDVVAPIDVESLGYWLKATFGPPTTTGIGPFTHVFATGLFDLPSFSYEKALPEVPHFAMYAGCRVDQLSLQMPRSGNITATVGIIAQGETVATSSQAGVLAEPTIKRFGAFNGAVRRSGIALGNMVSAEVTYNNNLDRIETIRADGKIDGVDPGIAALTGQIVVRFADATLLDQAINGTAAEMEFAYSLPTGESFTVTAHSVFLPRPRIEISGPAGVQATFDWQAALDSGMGRMATITLVNNVATY